MNQSLLLQELQFKAVRSSGAGGQHVNKVSTKIELSFSVANSNALSDLEKERLFLKLGNRLTKAGTLLIQCDESRSQHKNKELAIKRFLTVLKAALKVSKKRKKTKPSRAAIEKRLKAKKKASQTKANRAKPSLD
ncbi:MAG: alternative ribosome rescue aminoacyl-tRNA hydrolase ArfB [Maribacter sp.]|uniref:alternative ribosome rescue aminoacyl-tRNA hydrolase ArfB n=1 Tax=Maribacter sp. 2307UL18-2 TaxID=3386274 RepID=UPI0039BC603B